MGAALAKAPPRAPSPPASPFLSLPTDVLQTVCSFLELADRVRLLCTCKHLHNLEGQVLQLDDVAVQLADLRQAMAWAAWLGRHRGRVGRLAMQLPPPDARGWTQGLHTIQRAPWLWLALSGSPSLTHVTWNAMARDTRRPFYQHMSVGFTYAPVHLPALQQLVVLAPLVQLPLSLTQLSALTELAVAGYAVTFEPGCLPASLGTLAVDWCGMFDARAPHRGPHHQLSELAAAGGCRVSQLRLGWGSKPVCLGGLEHFTALTCLVLAGGYCCTHEQHALHQLSALTGLRQLSVQGLSGPEDDLGLLCGLQALQQLRALLLWGVALTAEGASLADAIWRLPALQDLTLTAVQCNEGQLPPIPHDAQACHCLTRLMLDATLALDSLHALPCMVGLQEATLLHGVSIPQDRLVALIHTLAALPELRRLEVRPTDTAHVQGHEHKQRQGEGQQHGQGQGHRCCVWLPEAARVELGALAEARPDLEVVH